MYPSFGKAAQKGDMENGAYVIKRHTLWEKSKRHTDSTRGGKNVDGGVRNGSYPMTVNREEREARMYEPGRR